VTNKIIQALPVKNVSRYIADGEDERRLMYVAITRSQKYLFVTRAPEVNDDGSLKKDYKKESIFAREISNSNYLISDKNPDFSGRPKLSPHPKVENFSILLNFSVLKAYFDCPYRFKLISMYGFNSPITERIGYGTSLHHILMELHRKYLAGTPIADEKIEDLVDKHLHLPYAPTTAVNKIKQSAVQVTTDYLEDNYSDFAHIQYAEKEIQLDLGDGIMVNGRMDLIKRTNLDGKEVTTIVDFKSRKDAQAQDLTWDQLAMYALGYKDLTGKQADMLQIFNLDEDRPSRQTQRLDNNRTEEIRIKIIDSAMEIKANKLDKTDNVKTCLSCYHRPLCSGAKS
jgi:DNA helicase-2/ATP-dependent DNA helicase PcrA